MLGFNEEKFLLQTRSALALQGQIEQLVDSLQERDFENVFLIGAGGTYAAMLPYEHFIRSRSTLPVRASIGKELMLTEDPTFGPGSVAVFASVSGTTEDVIESIDFAKAKGAYTVGFTGFGDSPFAKALDVALVTEPKTWPFDIPLLLLTTRLLAARGEFEGYEEFAAELQTIPETLVGVARQAEPAAEAFAEKNKDADYHFLVGAGNLWGFTYLYSMCILEEMQWLRTTRVHGAEFFHGSLELIEEDTSLMLFLGEDESRPLMERVAKFAENYNKNTTLLDTKDYELPGISPRFRGLLAPLVMDTVVDRISKHLERVRNHSLDLRRYYRVVEY
ncbi:fructoselysine-6-phosphate deglycase [Arthrobacter sp. V4I6]|uniref:SIS domain-containing protein n=1 Tax=unclassified Arthrobacter TaxID=235627 RepID=UPI00277E4394|nr:MULTISPECIES: SIS domain-containing protein [unclassified Arthrobacter]MDQ0819515.1 fructoselysine-6-phosphate deglycase [Arthrobacter sp. V1I7]MDQ0853697.1 fructoselysine-6-phosphate deglycase [Arthrobacter sp. V4I6]